MKGLIKKIDLWIHLFCFLPPKNVMKAYFLAYQDVTFKSAVKNAKNNDTLDFQQLFMTRRKTIRSQKRPSSSSDHLSRWLFAMIKISESISDPKKRWFSNFDRNWFFEIWNFFSNPFTYFQVHAKMAWLGFFSVFIWDALENYFIRSVSNSLPPPNV